MWQHTLKLLCKLSYCWLGGTALTAWAICSAFSQLWSSIPSPSSAAFSWKIICVCGDWLVLPPTSNPFVVSQVSFHEFFMWKLPFNHAALCHFSLVQNDKWQDILSSSSLPALIACCPAFHFVHQIYQIRNFHLQKEENEEWNGHWHLIFLCSRIL